MKLFIYQNTCNLISIAKIHMRELRKWDENSWDKGLIRYILMDTTMGLIVTLPLVTITPLWIFLICLYNHTGHQSIKMEMPRMHQLVNFNDIKVR